MTIDSWHRYYATGELADRGGPRSSKSGFSTMPELAPLLFPLRNSSIAFAKRKKRTSKKRSVEVVRSIADVHMPTLTEWSNTLNHAPSSSTRLHLVRIRHLVAPGHDCSDRRTSSDTALDRLSLEEAHDSTAAAEQGVSTNSPQRGSPTAVMNGIMPSEPDGSRTMNTEKPLNGDGPSISPLREQPSPTWDHDRDSHSPSSSLNSSISPLVLEQSEPDQPFGLEEPALHDLGVWTEDVNESFASRRISRRASSCYTRRSSISSTCSDTLIDYKNVPSWQYDNFSIISPVEAGVFDDTRPGDFLRQLLGAKPSRKTSIHQSKNKPLPPDPPLHVFPLRRLKSRHIVETMTNRKNSERIGQASILQWLGPPRLIRLDEQPEAESPEDLSEMKLREKYPRFSQAADELEIELAKIGELTNSSRSSSPAETLSHDEARVETLEPRPLSLSFDPRDIKLGADVQTPEYPSTPNIAVIMTSEDKGVTSHQGSPRSLSAGEQPRIPSLKQHPPRISPSSSERNLRLLLPRLRTDRLEPSPTPSLVYMPDPVRPNIAEPESPNSPHRNISIKEGKRPDSTDQKILITLSKPGQCSPDPQNGDRTRELDSRSRPPLNALEPIPIIFELDANLPSAAVKTSPVTETLRLTTPAVISDRVILSLLENLPTMNDLFNFAIMNKNFYRVFKTHEMRLIKDTMFRVSPPAWELREMSPPWDSEWQGLKDPDAPVPEYTPTLYLRNHSRDILTLVQLKTLILARCSSFLRRDTVRGLAGLDEVRAAEVDEALWRIWTFCRIFGCGKNRETDTGGQIDWLNGGRLTNQQKGGFLMAQTSFSMNNVFFDPPDGFGQGNGSQGLSSGQLYDMNEIWTCLGVLLQELHSECAKARRFGIFDGLNIPEGDISKEEAMLEEWTYYVLTLGPLAVLKLSAVCPNASAEATFRKAEQMGLTKWDVPETGSTRTSFLREAVSRTYETRAPGRVPRSTSQTNFRGQVQELSSPQETEPSQGTDSKDPYMQPQLAPISRADQSFLDVDDGPSERFLDYEDDAPGPDHPQPQVTPLPAAVIDPVDRAINMMVNKLGFDERDAKWALKITDQGDSLDVDAAVRLLTSERKKRERNLLFSKFTRSTSMERGDSRTALVDPIQHRLASNSGPGWRWA